MSQKTITIPTGGQDPHEFMLNLSKSVSEVFMLVFERRELDLSEDEAYALWCLANMQSQLVGWKK